MEKFELEEKLQEEIRSSVRSADFMRLVQSVRRGGTTFKIAIRPVEIGGERKFQAEMTEGGQVQVKNFSDAGIGDGIEEIIAQKGARELHLMMAKGDLHIRVTKKGHVMVSRSAAMDRTVELRGHDRVKKTPLTSFESVALLRTIGLTDGEGKVRASMRGKYDQVNEFLKVVGETVSPCLPPQLPTSTSVFTVVDCGCGKAYLTISLWYYLTEVLKYPEVRIIGVDRRNDVVEAARKMAKQLDLADKVTFVESDLATFNPSTSVSMVVSLHACDTATDEALAKGVEWKARYILSAPCCQHELQKVLAPNRGAFDGLLRQSILRERLCDILTDSFRAMIMRSLGFKTQVIEFVSSEATARNVLLKCEYGVKPGQPGPVGEYLALRDYWKVTPWLETRLTDILKRHLSRYE